MTEPTGLSVAIDISPGELIDRITILEIKSERIGDPAKLKNVRRELSVLADARDRALPESDTLSTLAQDLKRVNEALWDIEDAIRVKEKAKDFGDGFVDLARSVYRRNDDRAVLKRKINDLLGAAIIEEKSYEDY